MSTPQAALVEALPKPAAHTLEWHARGQEDMGWVDFYDAADTIPSDWDGPPPDEVRALYTADQMRAHGEACARAALAQAEAAQPVAEPVAYLARSRYGSQCHFGMKGAAESWAGHGGEVFEIPLRHLGLVSPSLAAAAPQPAEAAPTADIASENAELRHLLAVRVAGALLYTDDGELSDASELPAIDFKRDAPGEIARKLTDRGLKNLTKAERVHALVNAGPYPGMSEAFDAHMGAACWTDPVYRQDAATFAAAWKAAISAAEAAPKQEAAETQEPYQPTDMRDGLVSIRRYGLDTLSGRTDGPADAAWYRAAVNEMTRRARLALSAQPQQPAPVPVAPSIVAALRFYAQRQHFAISDRDAWDTVSGEPQNYWCDEAGTATVEDGSIARIALQGIAAAPQTPTGEKP